MHHCISVAILFTFVSEVQSLQPGVPTFRPLHTWPDNVKDSPFFANLLSTPKTTTPPPKPSPSPPPGSYVKALAPAPGDSVIDYSKWNKIEVPESDDEPNLDPMEEDIQKLNDQELREEQAKEEKEQLKKQIDRRKCVDLVAELRKFNFSDDAEKIEFANAVDEANEVEAEAEAKRKFEREKFCEICNATNVTHRVPAHNCNLFDPPRIRFEAEFVNGMQKAEIRKTEEAEARTKPEPATLEQCEEYCKMKAKAAREAADKAFRATDVAVRARTHSEVAAAIKFIVASAGWAFTAQDEAQACGLMAAKALSLAASKDYCPAKHARMAASHAKDGVEIRNELALRKSNIETFAKDLMSEKESAFDLVKATSKLLPTAEESATKANQAADWADEATAAVTRAIKIQKREEEYLKEKAANARPSRAASFIEASLHISCIPAAIAVISFLVGSSVSFPELCLGRGTLASGVEPLLVS